MVHNARSVALFSHLIREPSLMTPILRYVQAESMPEAALNPGLPVARNNQNSCVRLGFATDGQSTSGPLRSNICFAP